MSTKVYTITLAGGGDIEMKVVNKVFWDWVMDGGPCPQEVKDEYKEQYRQYSSSEEQLQTDADELDLEAEGSSPDNDRALAVPQSRYNGEVFNGESLKELNAFLKRHDLEIEEEYEGYIY